MATSLSYSQDQKARHAQTEREQACEAQAEDRCCFQVKGHSSEERNKNKDNDKRRFPSGMTTKKNKQQQKPIQGSLAALRMPGVCGWS
jgi:hypothetical protein